MVARVFGRDKQLIRGGMFPEPWNHEPSNDEPAARHTVPLETLTGSDSELLASTRLVATDLFNAFGAPEVAQIDELGRLRIRHCPGNHHELAQFAETHGVEVIEDTVLGS